ncbi:AraC-type DNA-binding protein [Paenibacillus algorifonticola]|uniref:AraC-type DNA-binding protein n=1 Tax=Paenibacillus algorifonticola TaxID=684063 RepID=A0A1I2AEY1_9BACL|nr:AraC family transcriptional regulator [Paenibacillus algorifonticola]SFE42098.1 AraC-type DNA-binding protein [Paenibacillus algorifonticola]
MQRQSTQKPLEQARVRTQYVQDSKDKIDKTVIHMEDHFQHTISREQLAEIAELNPDHYSRMFRKYKGTSPIGYLTGLRMEKAKTLLKHSHYSIAEIARLVGYSDPYHFSRRFKQLIGVAPTHFKEQDLPRIVALDGLGHCQALGMEPIAADLDRAGGYVHVSASNQLLNIGPLVTPKADLEQLIALHPQMIVTANSELEQQLSTVATTIKLDVLEDPIYTQLFAVAAALGREKEAAAWVKSYEAQCTELRSRLFGSIGGERVAILRVREQLLQVYGMLNMGYPIYHSLQLAPPDKISMQSIFNAHFHSSVISIEELPFYEAEHLLVVVQPDNGARSEWQEITQTEAWHNFPAVRMGNVHHIDVANWLNNDPISILKQMHEAAELLMKGSRRRNYPSWMQ